MTPFSHSENPVPNQVLSHPRPRQIRHVSKTMASTSESEIRHLRIDPTPTVHFGRTEIIDKLNGLIGYHFSPVGVPNNTIDFDIAVLSQEVLNCNTGDGSAIDKEAVGGVLATLHSQILRSGSGQDRTMKLHQSFVLRRRTELDDGESEEYASIFFILKKLLPFVFFWFLIS